MKNTTLAMARLFGWNMILFATVTGCTTLFAPSIQTTVPPDRLNQNTYTSRDGGYSIAIPHRTAPDIWIEENTITSAKQGVRFGDGTGRSYLLLRVDNTDHRYTLDLIAEKSTESGLYRDIRYTESDRGKELRMVGLKKEGSRLTTQIKEHDQTVTKPLDLYKADCLFIQGNYVYEVSAGVVAVQDKSEEALFEKATSNLDTFLKGVKIK